MASKKDMLASTVRNKSQAELQIAVSLVLASSEEIKPVLEGIKDTVEASGFTPTPEFNAFLGILNKMLLYKRTLLDDFSEQRNSFIIEEIKDIYCSNNPSETKQLKFITWVKKVEDKLIYSDLDFIKEDGDMDVSELVNYYYWNCFKDYVEALDLQDISYAEKLNIKAPTIIDNTEDKDIVNISEVQETLVEESKYTMGIPSLDEYIKLQPTNLFFIAARPSVGKSAFVLNCSLLNCLREIDCLYVSLEMTPKQTRTRINHWIKGESKIRAVDVDLINKHFFMLDAKELNGDYIYTKIERFATRHPECMIFLDYIGLIRYTNMDEWGSLRKASLSSKSVALKTKCVFISCAMASRDSELSGLTMSSLYGSSTLEADGDGIIGLEPSKTGSNRESEILAAKILKNRDGIKDVDSMVNFDKLSMHFTDVN